MRAKTIQGRFEYLTKQDPKQVMDQMLELGWIVWYGEDSVKVSFGEQAQDFEQYCRDLPEDQQEQILSIFN